MKRRRLLSSESCCYHLTHRCQERRYLLRFETDRKNYLSRLRETVAKHPVDILDYMITSNHVHLLLWAPDTSSVSAAMQYLQGATARDYNRRKKREGSFWTGRFRPTLIQEGCHLSRCLFYIGMNMLRNNVVTHPSQWHCSGYNELVGKKQRYRIINQKKLLRCLFWGDDLQGFRKWYVATMEESVDDHHLVRQPIWTECAAVGDLEWIEKLASEYSIGQKEIISYQPRPYQLKAEASEAHEIREETPSYGLKITANNIRSFVKRISNKTA